MNTAHTGLKSIKHISLRKTVLSAKITFTIFYSCAPSRSLCSVMLKDASYLSTNKIVLLLGTEMLDSSAVCSVCEYTKRWHRSVVRCSKQRAEFPRKVWKGCAVQKQLCLELI